MRKDKGKKEKVKRQKVEGKSLLPFLPFTFCLLPLNTLRFCVFIPLFVFCCFAQAKDFAKYVNPFIGTGGHEHTFPGATLPFGMVRLSPDTRLDDWDGSSGYHYSDSVIYGFRTRI